MEEAQKCADGFAAVEKDKVSKTVNARMPRILSRIKQKRLSAREELKAVLHTLSLAGLEMCCERPLRPRNTTQQETRECQGGRPFLCHPTSGEAEWDVLQPSEKKKLGVILSPDEGGPLWSAFMWLNTKGCKVNFIRDELQLFCTVWRGCEHGESHWLVDESSESSLENLRHRQHMGRKRPKVPPLRNSARDLVKFSDSGPVACDKVCTSGK
ncbi:unnamed protein product [Symbiodinium sp. CCMP2456]|nr:unnamed protein product [Symbiodinium sp. CCMP2456]